MVPLGKIPRGSLYKAAGTLIVEKGLDKLGLFKFVMEHNIFSIQELDVHAQPASKCGNRDTAL